MSAVTGIEWTDRTWNPVRGCSVISPGCVNCYAMKTAHRFSGAGGPYAGLTKQTNAGPQWTGIVRPVESSLLEPLSWRKPARVFVNSMSDLFHENVDPLFVGRVFNVMGAAGRHTFQILTKRPARMLELVTDYYRAIRSEPFPNVWLGVSVENQHFADARIPLLLQTPAAVRFISAEPLLGPVDAKTFMPRPMFHCPRCGVEKMRDRCDKCGTFDNTATNQIIGLDWVIVGGESGPGARPFDLAWARAIVEHCKAAGVPVFVKQLGAKPVDVPYDTSTWVAKPDGPLPVIYINDRKGGDPSEWPEDLRVREFPR